MINFISKMHPIYFGNLFKSTPIYYSQFDPILDCLNRINDIKNDVNLKVYSDQNKCIEKDFLKVIINIMVLLWSKNGMK